MQPYMPEIAANQAGGAFAGSPGGVVGHGVPATATGAEA